MYKLLIGFKYLIKSIYVFNHNETNDILSKDIEQQKLSIPQQKQQKSSLLSTNAAI